MQAGKLNKRINIQSRTLNANEYGEQLDDWTDETGPLWAAIEPLTGKESTEADQVKAEVTHRVRLRYGSALNVTPDKRIRHGTRIFEIVSVIDRFERHRELVCMTRERM